MAKDPSPGYIEITDLAELKNYLLDALSAFDAFCGANGLRYYLSGGTLLGAVRHEGFIPWDDDVDLIMPRADYDRLVALTRGGAIAGRYAVHAPVVDPRHIFPFVKLYDQETYLVEDRHVAASESGVFIDIFPLDGCPEDPDQHRKLLKRIGVWRRLAAFAGTSVIRSSNPLLSLPRLAAVAVCKAFGSAFFLRRIDALARAHGLDACPTAAVSVWGYGLRERMPRDLFLPAKDFSFEGRRFKSTAFWDGYLSSLYGDYMKLPDEAKRQSHHEFRVYRKTGN